MRRILVAVAAAILFGMCAGSVHAATKPAKVAVIIKATDSDFWQYVLVGARNYAKENPDKVVVSTHGPKSEADIAQQVTILEDVISSGPDAIVIASTSSDATVPALEDAVRQGIVVITIDNKVKTDAVHSHLATDNQKAGELAGEYLVDLLKEKKLPLTGKVAIVSALAGVQSLMDRDSGFLTGLKKYAPDIEVIGPRYVDNDIIRALNTANDLMTSDPDIVGFFADNNHTGDGVARMIGERGLEDKVIAVAFDSDPEEIESLRAGSLKALVLQDPYGMGYKGVDFALQALAGQSIPKYVDTGVTLATPTNIDTDEVKGLLDPMSRAK